MIYFGDLAEQLSKIPELSDFNVYPRYLDETMVFPCITLSMIIIENEASSLQIKLWSLSNSEAEQLLINGYNAIHAFFDSSLKNPNLTREVFVGKTETDAIKFNLNKTDSSVVEEITAPVESKILTENVNDVEVLSLPIIFAAKLLEHEKPIKAEISQVDKI